jgi:uncharacterized protein YndB with AHSA1/START domain
MRKQIEKHILIKAVPSKVWAALTNPDQMKQWMAEPGMKIDIMTNWRVGQPILVNGFHHVNFENKGTVLQYEVDSILQYTHLSSISRLPNESKNYSVITFSLTPIEDHTLLKFKIDNFPTEAIFKHLDFYWRTTPEILKNFIEQE